MESLLSPQANHGIMDDQDFDHDYHHHHHHLISNHNSCSSSSTIIEEEEEEEEEVNSSDSSPLQDMSSLLQQLPLKRGLSKYYNGKSQSFTSLSNVRSLEDLAKQENPYSKKLKTCKSYGGFPRNNTCSRRIGKKPSIKGSNLSSLFAARRNPSSVGNHGGNNSNNRPSIHTPHRSASTSSFANQATPLFA